jgi:2,3-dihydroxybiphenyl 1,2-dioxygenase
VIRSLSYIGVTSPNAEKWLEFGPEILGLEVAGRGPDGAVRLRVDDAAWRISVHPGPSDDLAYLGWCVGGPAEFENAIVALEKHGLTVHRGDAALAGLRAVADVAWFSDPFGFRHEISWGLLEKPATFRPGRPMSGFVTGDGGLGHVVLIVPDLQSAERFLTEVLGFRLSDRIEAGLSLRFFHCNGRHHTLAIAALPGMVGMHHLMLEVASLDDVGVALDACNARKLPLAMTLGTHTNDRMTSFYVRSPSGFEIEYGFGGRIVNDADWVVGSYDAQSVWGHKRPENAPPPGVLRPFDPAARQR